MKALKKLCGSTILFLLLASCFPTSMTEQTPITSPQKPAQTISYAELLKPAECSLPCWDGIEVDRTEFQTAKQLLTEKYGADAIVSSDAISLEWDGNGINGVKSGYISFYEGIVNEIFIFFDVTGGISAEELLSVLEEPTWVFVNDQPNIYCQYLRLIYPALGIHADLNMLESKGNIEPSSRAVMIRFLQVRISENMQVYDGYLVRWDGYKNYCE